LVCVCVYTSAYKFSLCIDFYNMHGTRVIKIEGLLCSPFPGPCRLVVFWWIVLLVGLL